MDARWFASNPLGVHDPRMADAVADIGATLHGLPKEDLVGENVRQHKRVRLLTRAAITTLVVLLAIALVAGGLAWSQRNAALASLKVAQSRQMAAQAVFAANENPRLAAAYALTAGLLDDSAESRNAKLIVMENNRYVTATAVVSAQSVHSLATDGNTILVSNTGSSVVSVLTYPDLKMVGSFPLDGPNTRLAYRMDQEFVAFQGTHLMFLSSAAGQVPRLVSQIELSFDSTDALGPYVTTSGDILILSQEGEGFYWSSQHPTGFYFSLTAFPVFQAGQSLAAASGFQHDPYTLDKPSPIPEGTIYIATEDGAILSLDLSDPLSRKCEKVLLYGRQVTKRSPMEM